jgi:hypothetical protein
MKKFIFRLSLFAILVPVTLFFVIGVMGMMFPKTFSRTIKNKRGDVGYMYTRIKELKSIDSVDILIVGSSHAYRGFDPRVFAGKGIRIFDLGSSAQTPMQTEILVKKYISRVKPKLVIFEVFPGVFAIDGVESSVDLISNAGIDLSTVMMVCRVNNLITYNTLLFHGFKKLFFKNRFHEPECKNGECYIPGGYVERTQLVRFKGGKQGELKNWSFRDDQIRAFGRTIEYLKKNHYRTILVQAPITYYFYHSYENNSAIDQFYRSYGLDYYNFNFSKIGSSSGLFYDQDHLNMEGVEQFNNMVLSVINGPPGLLK